MSHSIQDERCNITSIIEAALHEQDAETLYKWAGVLKEQGDDEEAQRLFDAATNIERANANY